MRRTQLEHAAAWIHGLALGDVPADVIALAAAQRINMLAALHAGSRTAVGQALLAAAERVAGDGPVRALPLGTRLPVLEAVYLHATLASAIELDDFVFAGHTGQAAVGVPLALGQITGASGEEALLAQIAADEVAGRLGAVMTTGPQQGHMKAYLHRLAAAVAAARLLRLDEVRTASALAIALSAPEYPLFPGAFSPDTKALCAGDPVTAGVRAAFLADSGVGAARDIVEHDVGLVTSLSANRRVPPIWRRLGQTWSLQAITFKPVAACAHAAAAAIAAAEIARGEGDRWDVGRVARVDVDSTALTVTMEGFSRPHEPGLLTPANTNFSTRRTVALALLERRVPSGASFAADAFAAMRGPLAAAAQRVHLRHHWPYTIGLLRGVDAAIDHPGRPGIYGMSEAHSTMDRFRAAFGTPAALSVRDVPALLRLRRGDLRYLLRRYAVGLRARLPFASAAAREAYVSSETDLRRMALRFSARVSVRLDDGRRLTHEVITPPGFAGDDDRARIPREKFLRELGAGPAEQTLLALLEARPFASPSEIVAAFTAWRSRGEGAPA